MKRILSGVVAILLSGTAAFAADVYQPPMEPVPEQPVEVIQTSGWYLRGDVGYAWNHLRGANFYQGGPSGSIADFDSADIDDSWVIGGGVGYQFNNYFRADITADYWGNGDFAGSTSGGCGTVAGPCVSRDISSVSAWSLMANAYVDIGTYGVIGLNAYAPNGTLTVGSHTVGEGAFLGKRVAVAGSVSLSEDSVFFQP